MGHLNIFIGTRSETGQESGTLAEVFIKVRIKGFSPFSARALLTG